MRGGRGWVWDDLMMMMSKAGQDSRAEVSETPRWILMSVVLPTRVTSGRGLAFCGIFEGQATKQADGWWPSWRNMRDRDEQQRS
jgi:hypothetical protein